MRSLLFRWVLVVTRFCVSPLRVEFVCPSIVEFLQSNPTGLHSQMLWGLLLPISDPQAWEPDVGLWTFTPVGEPLWYNYFHLWVTHLAGTGFDFIILVLILLSPYDFLFVFGYRVSFLVGFSVLFSMVIQQLVVISVFSWAEMSSHPSALPSCLSPQSEMFPFL